MDWDDICARTTFLLGAGASLDCGLPVLTTLTQKVGKRLASEQQETFLAVRRQLESQLGAATLNIEQFLSVIDTLLVARLPLPGASLRALALLQHEVRTNIWDILRNHGPLDALHRLQDFMRSGAGLDVFSLNNDTVIEDWCIQTGVPLFVGFDQTEQWRPD